MSESLPKIVFKIELVFFALKKTFTNDTKRPFYNNADYKRSREKQNYLAATFIQEISFNVILHNWKGVNYLRLFQTRNGLDKVKIQINGSRIFILIK